MWECWKVSERINRPASDERDRRKEWVVHGQERNLTSQVAIPRRVYRYKRALRDRQATSGRGEKEGGLLPMAWGWHIDPEKGMI